MFFSANSKLANPTIKESANSLKKVINEKINEPNNNKNGNNTKQQDNIFDVLNDLFDSSKNQGNNESNLHQQHPKITTEKQSKPKKNIFQGDNDKSTKIIPDTDPFGPIINLAPRKSEKVGACDSETFKKVLLEMNNIYNNQEKNYNINPNEKIDESTQQNQNNHNFMSSSNNKKNLNSSSINKEEKSSEEISKSEPSNINIYNIQNNINSFSIYDENLNIEEIANAFLNKELSKANLHWLINSSEIKLEQKIGFGGTSEVFKATYRGTDVAVKKLRISEVQEENLKEFKREVILLVI